MKANKEIAVFSFYPTAARQDPLPLAITTRRRFITQELWQFPAKEVCSFQAAIFQRRFHRFFRGRDSMKANRRIAVLTFGLPEPLQRRKVVTPDYLFRLLL